MSLELPTEPRRIGKHFLQLGYSLNPDGSVEKIMYGYEGDKLEDGMWEGYFPFTSIKEDVIEKIVLPLAKFGYRIEKNEQNFELTKKDKNFLITCSMEPKQKILVIPQGPVPIGNLKGEFLTYLEMFMEKYKEP